MAMTNREKAASTLRSQALDVIEDELIKTVQPELDRLGSSMKAVDVVIDRLAKLYDYNTVLEAKDRLVTQGGVDPASAIAVALDAELALKEDAKVAGPAEEIIP